MRTKHNWIALAVTLAAAWPAHALDLKPDRLIAGVGASRHGTQSLTLGAAWPWEWRGRLGGTEVTGATEAFISHWRADAVGGGRQSFTQLGLLPVLRFRFDGGQSPWFAEAGIGVTWMDKRYRVPEREFSTTGNFIDVLGVGRSFGADHRHELGLRLTHISNAGIKRPNPGEEFLQLRYAVRF